MIVLDRFADRSILPLNFYLGTENSSRRPGNRRSTRHRVRALLNPYAPSQLVLLPVQLLYLGLP